MPERAAFHAIAARVRNWGRWGPDDQLGTLNFVDAAARHRAVAAVRTGEAYPLGLPLSEEEGIQAGLVPGRVNPMRSMVAVNNPLSDDPEWISSSEDVVTLALQCATHWDALAHVSYDGRLYNGHPASSVTEAGASRCGIEQVRTLVTRGLLLDVARARGEDILPPGYGITPDDLDAACALGGLRPERGDAVLVRTGQMAHLRGERTQKALFAYAFPAPGLTMACAEWLRAHDVAAVATDTLSLEVFPGEDEAIYLPVHLLHLVEMGLTQGQNFVLDELAEACEADGVYDFFLDATPLPFTHALGSPVNPVVVR
ncbi:MAG TPA: cyclase family protein [Acidimicrobiales bacterium]|nr:cyclase family protein [Acidimicrobiales bacterium]